MGEWTVELRFFAYPSEQTWAIARVIDQYQLTEDEYLHREGCTGIHRAADWSRECGTGISAWDLGYLEPGEFYRGIELMCGYISTIADFLIEHAPGASWTVSQQSRYESLGEQLSYAPDLGRWATPCDPDGNPVYGPEQVRTWLERALAGEDPAQIAREYGKPWLDLAAEDRRVVPIGPDPGHPSTMPEPENGSREPGGGHV